MTSARKTKTSPKAEPKKVCLHHEREGLENSLTGDVSMETSLSIELARAHAALSAALAALKTASKAALKDRGVQATIAVLEDALP